MEVASANLWQVTFGDVPVNDRLSSVRVSDANFCIENATGAATQNVSASEVPAIRVSGHEKPILNNRSSKSPIEPVEMGRGTVRTKPGQMVRKRFSNHPGR